jgi:8-oxo-dGTP pyrophosphatase MutT (NUDIX family)
MKISDIIVVEADDVEKDDEYYAQNYDEPEHQKALDQTGFWGKQAAGAIIMAKSTGRILLSFRSGQVEEPHTWGVWGGAIDDGETPLAGAYREASEELGSIRVEHAVPLYVFKSGSFQYSNFLFIVGDEFSPNPSEEHSWETEGYDWVEFGNWPSPLHPGLEALFGDPASMSKIESFVKLVVDKQ